MTEYLSEHWILSILLTILLGAVGSGLWDALLKPIGNKIAKALFRLLTFGTKRAYNRIFKEAAKGHRDRLSLEILTIVISVIIGVLFANQTIHYLRTYSTDKNYVSLKECSKLDVSSFKNCINKELKLTLHKSTLFIVFMTVIALYRLMFFVLVNDIIARYEQRLKAIRPYLKDNEYFLIEQQFATMSTKEDFLKINTHMHTIALKNDFLLP